MPTATPPDEPDDGSKSRFFGFTIDVKNVQLAPGNTYTYDLYDNVRRKPPDGERKEESR